MRLGNCALFVVSALLRLQIFASAFASGKISNASTPERRSLRRRTTATPPETYHWRHCFGAYGAYTGAWFAAASTVLNTAYENSLGMEAHDFNLFNQGGHTHPRMAFKPDDAMAFRVDHMSAQEHHIRRKPGKSDDEVVRITTNYAAALANRACAAGPDPSVWPTDILGPTPIGLIPFYGGKPEKSKDDKAVGNAHSLSPRGVKTERLVGVLCSIQNQLAAQIKVGVCTSEDEESVINLVRSRRGDLQERTIEVIKYECEHSVYLSFIMLRDYQAKIKSGVWNSTYVYFTEDDQVLHVRRENFGALALTSAIAHESYVVPNRYEMEALQNSCERGILYHTSRRRGGLLTEQSKDHVDPRAGFLRCTSTPERESNVFLMTIGALKNFETKKLKGRISNQPYHAVTEFHMPWRQVLKTADPRSFYVLQKEWIKASDSKVTHLGDGNVCGDVYRELARMVRDRNGANLIHNKLKRTEYLMEDAAAVTYIQSGGDRETLRWGLCSYTAFFRKVSVTFCNTGDGTGKQLADWVKESGGSLHLDITGVECTKKSDVMEKAILHAQKLAEKPGWSRIKFALFTSLEDVVHFNPASPATLPNKLTDAVSDYTVLMPHRWAGDAEPGDAWHGSCDKSRDWLLPMAPYPPPEDDSSEVSSSSMRFRMIPQEAHAVQPLPLVR